MATDSSKPELQRHWTVAQLEALTDKDDAPDATWCESDNRRDGVSWWGVGSLDTLKTVLREGWTEGLERSRETLGKVADEVPVQARQSFRRVRVRAAEGDEYDPIEGRYGDYERAWESRIRQGTRANNGSQVTSIYVQVGANCHTDADKMFYGGAVAAIVTDRLERAGRAVEIVGYSRTKRVYHDVDGITEDVFPIKDAGTPLDLEKLTTVTALGGWFRLCIFHAFCNRRKVSGGLGSQRDGECSDMTEGDVSISGVWTHEAACDKVREVLSRFTD